MLVKLHICLEVGPLLYHIHVDILLDCILNARFPLVFESVKRCNSSFFFTQKVPLVDELLVFGKLCVFIFHDLFASLQEPYLRFQTVVSENLVEVLRLVLKCIIQRGSILFNFLVLLFHQLDEFFSGLSQGILQHHLDVHQFVLKLVDCLFQLILIGIQLE